MATDLGPLASTEFTSVVQAPDDGEPCNAAMFVNALQPLVNRTKYLQSQILMPSELRPALLDDFVGAYVDAANNRIFGNTGAFVYSESGTTHTITAANSDANGYADLSVANASGAGVFFMQKSPLVAISAIERFVCRVSLGNIATSNKAEYGVFIASTLLVADNNNDGVSVFFDPAVSANWQLRTNDGVTPTNYDSGIPVVASQKYHMVLTQTSTPSWTLEIDGLEVAEATANLPSSALFIPSMCNLFETASSGASRTQLIDLMGVALNITRGL